ncbi:MAG: YraN family protein [Betaproteobacteria bacterium HGW-Betaproteobacteria-8]|nr:MAG: YraN family protein [Betaproteobacteria bacterium HGW-Betaproteobacteria-8]
MNTLGSEAENIAAIYLQQQGLTLLDRNYQSRYGEIDLIMRDGKCLVFIEVRLRSNTGFGGAAMSITPSKQQKIIRTAEQYLQKHGNANCRFDVILMSKASKDGLEWIQNAFDAG